MKLKNCEHGKLVQSKDGKIGMIVGITNNVECADESERSKIDRAIPVVQWSCGRTCGINAANIELMK
jgi:Na+/H+-translocating membrane pyrophosphatase